MIQKENIHYGDIVWVDFDPSIGHEYKKTRPALVIQKDEQTKKSNFITIIPITLSLDKKMVDDIVIAKDDKNNLFTDSLIKVYCITSFDYIRVDKKIGIVSLAILQQVKNYLKKHFGL